METSSLLGGGEAIEQLDILPLHLSIAKEGGRGRNVHLLENGDIRVTLKRGQAGTRGLTGGDVGTVVIALGVDRDHDEVHYESCWFNGDRGEPLEVISQAIEALTMCRDAMRQLAR